VDSPEDPSTSIAGLLANRSAVPAIRSKKLLTGAPIIGAIAYPFRAPRARHRRQPQAV
jgi:hypothetical protein